MAGLRRAVLLQWAAVVVAFALAAACRSTVAVPAAAGDGGTVGDGSDGSPPPPPQPPPPRWQDCHASDQAWVRRAILMIAGRRPLGLGEVQAWVDVLVALRQLQGSRAPATALEAAESSWGPAVAEPRRWVALAMTQDPAYRLRWRDALLDALRVNRVEVKAMNECYALPADPTALGTDLAVWVRDHSPREAFAQPFNLGHLVDSALLLDDLSPLWRAHLMAMIGKPLTAANVGPLELERARRQDFGRIFDATYLHRDLACMTCHNSEFSVTQDADPRLNRHWPMGAALERALFGSATGKPPTQDPQLGPPDLRVHAVFRHLGVADGEGLERPWGWTVGCGALRTPTEDDPLGHDAWFGDVRGGRASVWDLQASLARGVADLPRSPIPWGQPGQPLPVPDADRALAWMVAQSTVEQVWAQMVGSPLSTATWFARTSEQRSILQELTHAFVTRNYSLRHLVADIAAHPLFALAAPASGCGGQAYALPRVYDPWTNHEADPGQRNNSPGDAVHGLPPRLLLRSLHLAMDWPAPAEFPQGAEQSRQAAVGVFLKDADPGGRGMDFQSRLTWEAAYGACPRLGSKDAVDALVERMAEVPSATWRDAAAALKDLLIGEPFVAPSEEPLLEALWGVALHSQPQDQIDARLRRLCGVLVATPQFLLGGSDAPDRQTVPLLAAPDTQRDPQCLRIATAVEAASLPWRIDCQPMQGARASWR